MNEVSKLNEICQERGWDVKYHFSESQTSNTGFFVHVNVNGKDFKSGYAESKKNAKKSAAKNALEFIDSEYNFGMTQPGTCVGNSNAKSRLNALSQKNGWNPKYVCVKREGLQNIPRFTYAVLIGEQTYDPFTASSIAAAQRGAAENALKSIEGDDQHFEESYRLDETSIGSIIHRKCMEKYKDIVSQIDSTTDYAEMEGEVIAGVLLSRPDANNRSAQHIDVVALATGYGCIQRGCCVTEGEVLFDSHAVTLARRVSLLYLYEQVELQLANENSIFATISYSSKADGKLSLRTGYRFHFYVSTSPCGDASCGDESDAITNSDQDFPRACFPIQHQVVAQMNSHGDLQCKSDADAEDWSNSLNQSVRSDLYDKQTSKRLNSRPLPRSMSCSDKILLWNCLGFEGNLLGQYISHIFLSSITVGSDSYNAGRLCRALCCRAEFSNIKVHHPSYYSSELPAHIPTQSRHQTKAFNWHQSKLHKSAVELTDTRTGLQLCRDSIGSAERSRLCKASLLERYCRIKSMFEPCSIDPVLSPLYSTTYHCFKQINKDRIETKRALLCALQNSHRGVWRHKPESLANFCHKSK